MKCRPTAVAVLRSLCTEASAYFKLYIYIAFQDPNKVPYDPAAPIPQQVEQSVKASLHNLNTSYINSLVLHSPLPTHADNMVGSNHSFDHAKRAECAGCHTLRVCMRMWVCQFVSVWCAESVQLG